MNKDELKQLIRECVKEALDDMDSPEGAATMRSIHIKNLDQFTKSYITTALWTSTANFTYQHGEKDQFDPEYDEDEEEGEEEVSEPMDKNYTIEDFEPNTLNKMIADCQDFQQKYKQLYSSAGWTDDMAGYDFWFTRNHHGHGFWARASDRNDTLYNTELARDFGQEGLEKVGKALTDAAHSYGEYNLYIGSGAYDGLICGG